MWHRARVAASLTKKANYVAFDTFLVFCNEELRLIKTDVVPGREQALFPPPSTVCLVDSRPPSPSTVLVRRFRGRGRVRARVCVFVGGVIWPYCREAGALTPQNGCAFDTLQYFSP